MSEQQFDWNYFENEVVIRDKQDKKRMIVLVFSNFMCIPYNRKSFDELVDLLNEQQATIYKLEERDYYNQSERYKILGRAIELASDYIHMNNLEYYDFCGLVTEFEKELLANGK